MFPLSSELPQLHYPLPPYFQLHLADVSDQDSGGAVSATPHHHPLLRDHRTVSSRSNHDNTENCALFLVLHHPTLDFTDLQTNALAKKTLSPLLQVVT